MIVSFADHDTELLWQTGRSRRLPPNIQGSSLRRLRHLQAALTLEDLRRIPGNRLEALQGNRKGQYSIRINAQWRVYFVWTDQGAEDVEIVDYHR